jgi:hypothetical protein
MTDNTKPKHAYALTVVTDARAKKAAFDAAIAAVDAAARDYAVKTQAAADAAVLKTAFNKAGETLADLRRQHGAAITRAADGKSKFKHPGGAAYDGNDVQAALAAVIAAGGDEIEGEEGEAATVKQAKKTQKDFFRDSKLPGEVNKDDPFAFTGAYAETVAEFVTAAIAAETTSRKELDSKTIDLAKAEHDYNVADARVEPAAREAYVEARAAKAPAPTTEDPSKSAA